MNYKEEVLKYYPDASLRESMTKASPHGKEFKYYYFCVGDMKSLTEISEINPLEVWELAYNKLIKPLRETTILKSDLSDYVKKEEFEFGSYVEIEQFRYGAKNEVYIYKVIKQLHSNGYIDVPVKSPNDKEYLHDNIVDVVACICCGVSETKVEKFKIDDVKPTNKRFA